MTFVLFVEGYTGQVTYGAELFGELDPIVASAKCPYLKAMLEDMQALAEKAGLKKI